MSIYHLSVKTLSRSTGRSAVAAAAYRAGERIVDARTGLEHDYTRRSGVVSADIYLPPGAPAWAGERGALWNAAEGAETRKNSTVGREFEVALPAELSGEQRRALVAVFAAELAARHGVAVDAAIHLPDAEGDNRNHHAHILTSTRRLGPDGFGEKARELDAKATGPGLVEEWRARWAELTNTQLERAGSLERVDHRSLAVQREAALARGDAGRVDALDRAPGIKLGWQAADHLRRAEKRGEAPTLDRAVQAKAIAAENAQRRSLLAQVLALAKEFALEVREGMEAMRERIEQWRDGQFAPAGPPSDPPGRGERLAALRERMGLSAKPDADALRAAARQREVLEQQRQRSRKPGRDRELDIDLPPRSRGPSR